MPILLVQGCSKTKKSVSKPVEAFELYDGYYYKIIKKAIRQNEFNADIDICILSAEHGLLDPNDKISTYDRKMDQERAEKLREDVVSELQMRIQNDGYDTVLLNLGETYRRAVAGFETYTDATVQTFEGGLGERGHYLKKIIRGDMSPKISET